MPGAWPGRESARKVPTDARGKTIEDAVRSDLAQLGDRFHPCVQLHEFEALLFVEPKITAISLEIASQRLDHEQIATRLQEVKKEFGGHVQRINDSEVTAPSKRLQHIVEGYDKVAFGVTATFDVTVDVLRAGCPWLDRWLTELESLD